MKDVLILMVFGLAWLFPVLYAYKHKMKNKMLFLFSSYGAEMVIATLIAGIGIPFYIFSFFMLPQLEALDDQYQWINRPIDMAIDYFWLISPMLLFIISHGIRIKYQEYFLNEENT
jgi:hypothetical protein